MSPTNLVVLEQLVNLDLSEKNFPAAMNRVQSRLQQSPDLTTLYLLVARIQIALIAHDGKKEELLTLVGELEQSLREGVGSGSCVCCGGHTFVATDCTDEHR